jgi:hypothetical protein
MSAAMPSTLYVISNPQSNITETSTTIYKLYIRKMKAEEVKTQFRLTTLFPKSGLSFQTMLKGTMMTI